MEMKGFEMTLHTLLAGYEPCYKNAGHKEKISDFGYSSTDNRLVFCDLISRIFPLSIRPTHV